MKGIVKAGICILAFALFATVSLPIRSFNIHASNASISHITLVDGDTAHFKTGAPSVGQFFHESGVSLKEKDLCSHPLDEAVWDGMTIYISRGVDVNICIDGIWKTHRINAGMTAGQLQTQLQYEYGVALLLNGNESQSLTDGDVLVFSTWHNGFFTENELIPYEVQEYETTSVRIGSSYVRQEGAPGEQAVTTGVVLIGGQEYKREVTGIFVLTEPIARIVDIGIGGKLGTQTDVTVSDFHYKEKLVMNATAYTAGYGCTGKNPGDPGYGITASGRYVQPGIVAVDPTIIPLGTHLYVEGYGFSIAADVGSAIKGHKIDLFIESLDDALRFGRRDIVVYILG